MALRQLFPWQYSIQLHYCRLVSKVGLLAEFMVSMMSVKGDTTLNYGKHSQTALTVCQ